MKEIGAVTIGNLIKAHYEKDEHKFKTYAEFIAEAYKEKGEERAERIIRSKIDGSYKNKPVAVTLDNERKEELKDEMKNRISMALKDPVLQQGFEIICKENAELKKKNKELDVFLVAGTTFNKALNSQNKALEEERDRYRNMTFDQREHLTKAKEIIKKFSEFVNNKVEYDPEHPQEHTDLWNELCEQAEQFLNSEVEK